VPPIEYVLRADALSATCLSAPSLFSAMKDRSPYQQRVIKDYYKNREAIALQRLSELVTELYLAEGKRRDKVWERIAPVLANLGLKPERIEHLRKQDKPEVLARVVEECMTQQAQNKPGKK
jgi:hypothetical protein